MKAIAVIGTLVAGSLALPGAAAASPLVAGAASAAKADPGLVAKAQYGWRRPVVRPYRVYRPVRVVRPYPVYRPVRVVRPYPVYRPVRVVRPYPRTVCRTRIRLVRTAYGDLVRRPVRRCVARY
jgi:hypothetical protein